MNLFLHKIGPDKSNQAIGPGNRTKTVKYLKTVECSLLDPHLVIFNFLIPIYST